MEALEQLSPLALHVSILLIVFAIGLDATFHDATYVLKCPRLLLRSLASIIVIVPAFAALMIAVFPLTPVVKTGIVLMAVSPFPPIVPRREIGMGGREPYVYGLLVAISVLAIATVPLTVALLDAAFSKDAVISPAAIARLVVSSVILPLAIGMAIRRIAPSLAERSGPIISKAANIVLIIGVLPLLIAVWPVILRLIGNGTILAIMAVVIVGLLAGHLLGGPAPRDRAVLAISSALRHPGIALVIAGANFPEPSVKAAILLFLLVSLIVSIPYQVWCKRRYPMLAGTAHAVDKTD